MLGRRRPSSGPVLSFQILDFGGLDSSIIFISRGWDSDVRREFPGNYESTNLSMDNLSMDNLSMDNLSRDNLSREIGHTRIRMPVIYYPLP